MRKHCLTLRVLLVINIVTWLLFFALIIYLLN